MLLPQLRKEQGEKVKVIGFFLKRMTHIARRGSSILVALALFGCDYTGGYYPRSHYTFGHKNGWLLIYQDGLYIGSVNEKRFENIARYRREYAAGKIDKDELQSLIEGEQ